MKKGLSIEDCIEKSRKFIFKYGSCLLLFDVKNSRSFKDRQKLNDDLFGMMEDLNKKFDAYLPQNNLASIKKEKGFVSLLGDGSWAGVNSPGVVEEIINYQKRKYPHIPLYWGIAKDGRDEEGTKIVRQVYKLKYFLIEWKKILRGKRINQR